MSKRKSATVATGKDKPGCASVNGSTASSDLRSPIAKARDKFLASEEGQKLTDPGILKSRDLRQYLENRIELAFLAGVHITKQCKL